MSSPNYVIMVEYEGFAGDMDRKIRKVAKRREDGSGYDLRGGIRDMSFYRKKKSGALRLFSRLTEIPNVKVSLEKYPGYM